MSSDPQAARKLGEVPGLAETSLELNPDEVTLETVLGDGSLGTVYKGVVRQNAVAIKVLNAAVIEEPGAMDAFKREMEALSFIRHPNLCLFMGYTLSPDKPMVVNEYLKNNLEVFLEDKEKGAVSIVERLKLAKEAALGLSWLHRNRISHRELKPSNILLDANNHAKVADYGLSRARLLVNKSRATERAHTLAQHNTPAPALYTSMELACYNTLDLDQLPYWTAPELLATLKPSTPLSGSQSLPNQLTGISLHTSMEQASSSGTTHASLTSSGSSATSRISYEKCDIYSFGIILWQLLTRREPFSQVIGGAAVGTPAAMVTNVVGYEPMYEDLESFMTALIQDKVRPEMPKDTLPALQELIRDCWDANPNRRPPFQSIVKRLDHVIVDYAIRDPLANKFWKDTFLNSGGDTVKWKEFCNSFATFLGITVAGSLNVLDLITINHHKIKDTSIPLDIRCLHAILVQHDSTTTSTTTSATANSISSSLSITAAVTSSEDTVSMEHFGKIMDWFGPIRKDARALILSRITEVLRRPWFHGDIATAETETRIMTRDVGTYLVRFSNSAPGVFAISKVAAPLKVNHLRVSREVDAMGNSTFRLGSHTADSLVSLIDAAAADYGLLYPCANPPYAYLFATQAPIGSYVEGGALAQPMDAS